MDKRASIIVLILLGVIIVFFSILYFVFQDLLYIMLALLCIGVLNIANGFVSLKSGQKTGGAIFLVGGIVLTCFMAIVILTR